MHDNLIKSKGTNHLFLNWHKKGIFESISNFAAYHKQAVMKGSALLEIQKLILWAKQIVFVQISGHQINAK